MFVEEEGGGGMQEAIEAGVSAYVIDGLTPKRVQPLIDTAIARFRHMDGLRNELKKTKDDLAARKVIERAKGMLMQHHGMTEDQAFSSIRTMSQQQGKPIKEVAENILTIVSMHRTTSDGTFSHTRICTAHRLRPIGGSQGAWCLRSAWTGCDP
jgi:response regulator NasT